MEYPERTVGILFGHLTFRPSTRGRRETGGGGEVDFVMHKERPERAENS